MEPKPTLKELLKRRDRYERASDCLTGAMRELDQAVCELRRLPERDAAQAMLDQAGAKRAECLSKAEALSARIEAMPPEPDEDTESDVYAARV